MFKWIFISFLFLSPNAMAVDAKYNQAIKTSIDAAAKQSGLEADFLKVKGVTTKKAQKLIYDLGLTQPAAVAGFVIPVLLKKKIRVKMKDFTIEGETQKVSATWQVQF